MNKIVFAIYELCDETDRKTVYKIKKKLIDTLAVKYPNHVKDMIEIINKRYNIDDETNENDDFDTESVCGDNFDELYSIIDNNSYIKNCKSNKNKDIHSLSSLIDIPLSQSDCIKIGNGVEKVLIDIILAKNKELKNIKAKNKKGEKETDHLFIDEKNKVIYYAELKSNLNLDTEKCKSTSQKCINILEDLKTKYPEYDCKMFLVGLRYFSKDNISKIINNKYTSISQHLVGINDYLSNLNIDCLPNEEYYKKFINHISTKMFQK